MDGTVKKTIKVLATYAPNFKTIAQLCRDKGLSRATVYRVFKQHPEVKESIEEILGTDIVETPKRETPKIIIKKKKKKAVSKNTSHKTVSKTKRTSEPVTVTYHPKDSVLPPLGKDDRVRLGSQVCDLLRTGATIKQACDIVGVGWSTFYAWSSPTHALYVQEVAEMKAEALASFNRMYDDEIVIIARNALQKIAEGTEVTQVTKTGRVDKKGDIKAHTVRQDTKKMAPNFSAAKFILEKAEAKKFGTPEERRDAERVKDLSLDYTHRTKTLEELEEEERELKKKLGL